MKKLHIKRSAVAIELKNLDWALESRRQNQQSALRLFALLKQHDHAVRANDDELFAQNLVGITFSLWRAAFLADKSGKKEKSFLSAISFLKTVIADNTITFTQDKLEKEWTFNYYMNNVRYTLNALAARKKYSEIVPCWGKNGLGPQPRWRYGQMLLDEAITNFEGRLKKK